MIADARLERAEIDVDANRDDDRRAEDEGRLDQTIHRPTITAVWCICYLSPEK